MKTLHVIQAIQTLVDTPPDGRFGKGSRAALERLLAHPPEAPWPPGNVPVAPAPAPVADPAPTPAPRVLRGDGTWKWTAAIEGDDIVVYGARATCFGGSNDPQDSGQTASGIPTKGNPGLLGCSLPMDGRMFTKLSPAEHRALDGSPIPRVPFMTVVRIDNGRKAIEVPVIDLGPGKRTGNAIDLTIAAARLFHPKASATNFEAQVDFRILGAAKYAPVLA